ncbi:hypothetical protein FFF34_013645 [Inquilinus sp. KBS0705]|nr:hypothetical protein FFF34_013645 [Inquilinus sp. KBS0705]
MNSIEEKLWSYIDGTCTTEEHAAIARLIEQDSVYTTKYSELLQLNDEFAAIELDEPSMAFTYKVMENIRAEHAKKPLKAAVDKRIILSIAAFFVITISALLVYSFSLVNWNTSSNIKLPQEVSPAHIKGFFTGPVVNGFMFVSVVMGLFILDNILRRKNEIKQG